MAISDTLNQIEDFEDCIRTGEIKVVAVKPGVKIPVESWSATIDINKFEEYKIYNDEFNLGISLTGQESPGVPFIACVDIDGDGTFDEDSPGVKMFTKEYWFRIIHNKLESIEGLDYMVVSSASGGYHIYFKVLAEEPPHTALKDLRYPVNVSEAEKDDEALRMFFSSTQNQNYFDVVAGEKVSHMGVEFFTNRRQVLLPGSEIVKTEDNPGGKYTLQPFGSVNSFKKLETYYSGSVNNLLREAFLEAGFTEVNSYNFESSVSNTKALSGCLSIREIKLLGNFLLKYYPCINGFKHYATLALSGYFSSIGLDFESVNALADYVNLNAPEGLFNNGEAFKNTLTHDILDPDENRQKAGLTTFEEYLEPFISKYKVGKFLHLVCDPTGHKFYPEGRYQLVRYPHLNMDFSYENMNFCTIQEKSKTDDDGIPYTEYTRLNPSQVNHVITGFDYIEDISRKPLDNNREKAVRLYYNMNKESYSETFKNTEEMFNEYKNLPGAYTADSKKIAEYVFREYESIGLINTEEGSTRPGIYWTRDEKTLKKFVNKNDRIVEVYPEMPSKEKLAEALNLLHQINDVYPWKDDKFPTIIRTGLIMPYAYAINVKYNGQLQSLLLHGEAGTLKTSAGELICNINNNDVKANEDSYITGGSEMNSPFRFGRAIDGNTAPLVINEAEYIFEQSEIREMMKDSAFPGKKCREPGGNNPQVYYSRRSTIYTLNNLPATAEAPEYLRRFISIEFTPDERGDTKEVLARLEFLNTDGIINNRFKELSVIGDAVFNIIKKSPELLKLSMNDLQTKIINELGNYSGADLGFLDVNTEDKVYRDRSEQEGELLTLALKALRYPFNKKHGVALINQQNIDNEMKLRNLIENSNEYNFVEIVGKNRDTVLITNAFCTAFNKLHREDNYKLSLPKLEALLNLVIVLDGRAKYKTQRTRDGVLLKGVVLPFDDFVRLIVGEDD